MSRQLSEHFTLAELCVSDTAARRGINNVPTDKKIIARLQRVAVTILEPVRVHYGVPISPTSGYRSPALNAVTRGASRTSQHMAGEAVDFEVPGISNYELALWCSKNIKQFGQLILEFHVKGDPYSGWVHCSLPTAKLRGQILTAERKRNMFGRMTTVYVPGLVK